MCNGGGEGVRGEEGCGGVKRMFDISREVEWIIPSAMRENMSECVLFDMLTTTID